VIGLVVSRADDASVAIGEQLRSLVEWDERTDPTGRDAETHYRHGDFELRSFEGWHLELDGVAADFSEPPAFVAFLSRHAGETGPLLTAHFTGNFGPAEYGGEPGELARTCPNVQRAVVAAFDRHAPEGYDVGVECTHHGPSDVGAPSLFVELGSSESEWEDSAGARAVAQSVLELSGVEPDAGADGGGRDTIAPDAPEARRHVVGFGGGHYAPEFERIVRETDWRVGHVAADWVLGAMGAPEANADLIERAFEQSAASRALLVGDNPELAAVVEDLGHRVVDETFLRATSGVDRALVAALEDALGAVDDGLRFGTPAEGAGADALDEFEVVSLPTDLLAETSGIDQEATLAVLRDRVLAFETVEGGTKPRGRAAVTDAAALDSVVDALADVLATKYDEVVRESAAIVATRETFDPAAAAEAGVPEGPAFGRLAGGDAVDVDGRTVRPEEVSVEETVRFPV
jgi:D-aminoacyl-tRNA deacylase